MGYTGGKLGYKYPNLCRWNLLQILLIIALILLIIAQH